MQKVGVKISSCRYSCDKMVRKTRELHKNYIGDIDIGLEANDIESNDKDIGLKANDYWAESQQSNLLSPTNPDLSNDIQSETI